MTIRRCRPQRLNSRTHLFEEGRLLTLCEQLLSDSYVVVSDAEIPTCAACVEEYTRRNRLKKESA